MGDFDKVIKENIEAIFIPLLNKLLNLSIAESFEIKDKIQKTIEREPDYLKRIIDNKGNQFILQLEFQTTDNPEMVYRMAEYKAILQRKYQLPVRQFVIYLGANQSSMRTKLPESEQITGFELTSIHDFPVEEILASDIPEEIILSILADFPKADTEKVIRLIIDKLQQSSKDENELMRYIQQLLVLSRLRNLTIETKQIIRDMPITYDITKDGLYLEGIEKGIEKGRKEGILQEKREVIVKALQNKKLTIEEIAELADVSIDFVLSIQSEKK